MGDFSRGFHRPDAGSHTVEGNVSGPRAMRLERQRQAEQEEFEAQKRQRQSSAQNASLSIGHKFQPARIGRVEEQAFKAKTVGLVSAADFLSAAKEKDQDPSEGAKTQERGGPPTAEQVKSLAKKAKKKRKQKKKIASLLSFAGEEDDLDQEDSAHELEGSAETKPQRKKSKKDPSVDTSFLPDKQRELEAEEKRRQLEREWKLKQERIRKEALEITYSYWDGSGHRRTCTTHKGASVGEFLEQVRQDLCGEFQELVSVAADALMYVKEDLILPQDITFYDLIVTKARGKSGPLFHFDVHEDVRLGPLDSRIEKDESHPGKVVERRWYERNKHIFPASRWEIFDPAKEYGKYTIHGGEVVTSKR